MAVAVILGCGIAVVGGQPATLALIPALVPVLLVAAIIAFVRRRTEYGLFFLIAAAGLAAGGIALLLLLVWGFSHAQLA